MAVTKYGSKFPLITIDNETNYQNASNGIRYITIEEYQDIMHHTHKVSDLVDADGNFIDGDSIPSGGGSSSGISKADFDALTETVINLSTKVVNLESENVTLKNKVTTIENENVTLSGKVTTLENENAELKSQIQELSENVGNGDLSIGDWDVDQPGKQDAEGNTIGN